MIAGMDVGIVYDERYLAHDTGPGHPERADRLRAIVEKLTADGLLDRVKRIDAKPAEVDAVTAIHGPRYVERVAEECERAPGYLDSLDTPICPESYETALLSAGGAIAAADAVMAGEVNRAFSMGRPPGHHAEKVQAMGFCLFNNIAIAAEHLVRRHGVERVAIVDFDVHHGNGTQHAFEDRGDVLFASTHEHPRFQFPGTGFEHETGNGAGAGVTLNVALLPGTGDAEARVAYEQKVLPKLDEFKPQVLMISAGFDAEADDPLGGLSWTADTFDWLTRELCAVADRHAEGRIVSTLEGGYNLASLARCVATYLTALLD